MKKSVYTFSVSLYLVFLLLSKQHHHNFRDLEEFVPLKMSECW